MFGGVLPVGVRCFVGRAASLCTALGRACRGAVGTKTRCLVGRAATHASALGPDVPARLNPAILSSLTTLPTARTGRAPIHVTVLDDPISDVNLKDPVGGFQGIPRNMTAIAQKLHNGGYATHMVCVCVCVSSLPLSRLPVCVFRVSSCRKKGSHLFVSSGCREGDRAPMCPSANRCPSPPVPPPPSHLIVA